MNRMDSLMTSEERPFIRVPSARGEMVRRVLLENGLLDTNYRIRSSDTALYLPVTTADFSHILDFLKEKDVETGFSDFEPVPVEPRQLSEVLVDALTKEELELLPRAYDLIGDIAVIEIPEELSKHKEIIGRAFLGIHKNFRTVLSKRGAISGQTRIREYDVLAGEGKTDTIHVEYGCRIAVDLSAAYFSPRLLEEHHQVAGQVSEGELIVDMFTGVGPFALHIARERQSHVVAIDINPHAIDLLKQSMTMNRLVGTIEPVVAHAGSYTSSHFDHNVDRIIMNHPSGAHEFIDSACHALRSGGVLHFYEFIGGDSPEDDVTKRITDLLRINGREVKEIQRIRRVRDSAPYEYQMVVDVVIM
jgi:tRNA (guanine37-N1)-methyltransferase